MDYIIRCDMGDDTYPKHMVGHHNRIIKEQSRIGLERLEHRLFPDKTNQSSIRLLWVRIKCPFAYRIR